MPRVLRGSWIENYLTFTRFSNSPEIFKKWAAIAAVSAALQRKVWLNIQGRQLFPNLYVVLVGPPGGGKTSQIIIARDRLSAVQGINLSPASVTPQKFLHLLAKANSLVPMPGGDVVSMCNYTCLINEMSSFIPAKDEMMMDTLTDLYDCPRIHTYETLSREPARIENLCLGFLAGTTPRSIADNLGAKAIGKGFTARINFIFSSEVHPIDLYGTGSTIDWSPFEEDLQAIKEIKGKFDFSPFVKKEIQEWISEGMPPAPTEGYLSEYLARRSLHLLKLCMIASAAEGASHLIEARHYLWAKETLLEAEAALPEVFTYVGGSQSAEGIRNLYHWLLMEYKKTKKPVLEVMVKRQLLRDIPAYQLESTLKEVLSAGYATLIGEGSLRAYLPVIKS